MWCPCMLVRRMSFGPWPYCAVTAEEAVKEAVFLGCCGLFAPVCLLVCTTSSAPLSCGSPDPRVVKDPFLI